MSSKRNRRTPRTSGQPPRCETREGHGFPTIINDLPAALPVSRQELEVIEIYLGHLLDAVLREGRP